VAVALLLTTALALAGFLITSVQGFSVAPAASIPQLARVVVGRHVGLAIPTVLLSLFSQSMVIFYFIGTGKLVKLAIQGFAEPERNAVLRALARLKMRTSPPATLALLSAIAAFVLGGAAHTRFVPRWAHDASAAAAVLTHLWALAADWRAFADNHALMNDPRLWARRTLAAAPEAKP
jgi:hypothetical protein